MDLEVKYSKKDFRRLSWKEYNAALENLHVQLEKYLGKTHMNIYAVVPILRGGAFAGTYLAYKLKLLRILPVQYKYIFSNNGKAKIKKFYGIRKSDVSVKSPVFLLVENNHCFGTTAQLAAKHIKRMFPKCTIIYAAAHADYTHRKLWYVDASFYGRFTNESKSLSAKGCKDKRIKSGVFLFPWEDMEEEWDMVNSKQYLYRDLKNT